MPTTTKNIMHWGKRVKIGHKQMAWSDVTVYEVPFSPAPSCDRIDAERVLSNTIYRWGKSGPILRSSYAATSYSLAGLDWERNIATVEESWGIGD